MDVCSTPSTRVSRSVASTGAAALVCMPRVEYGILEQVSRMTLEEPQTPRAPFQTPIVRKRKPSCVTPPRGHVISKIETSLTTPVASNSSRLKNHRELPPLLPNDFEMEGSADHNPFTRHKPMHSPATRVSNINLDFFSTFLEDDNKEELPRCKLLARTVASNLLGDFLLDLEDGEPPKKFLKMRRGGRDESPIPMISFDL
jgi:hypothetical protein